MDSAHRKIELQSPEDLAYLISNVRRAATEHVAAAFPPVEESEGQGGQDQEQEEDQLRVRIERLVDDYISQTFTLAAPNLSINGFDLDPKTFPSAYLHAPPSPTTSTNNAPNTRSRRHHNHQQQPGTTDSSPPETIIQYQPFDGRKRTRVEDLAREEEDLMRDIASLKRRVPPAAARAYAEGFAGAVRADEEALARAVAAVVSSVSSVAPVGGLDGDSSSSTENDKAVDNSSPAGDEDGTEKAGDDAGEAAGKKSRRRKGEKTTTLLDGLGGSLERQADVERGYEGLVGTLSRLKRDMPATVAKMERARVAGEYVVTER